MFGTVGLVKSDVSRFDGDLAHSGNGVPGIDAQVGQDLIDLGRIHFDRPQA